MWFFFFSVFLRFISLLLFKVNLVEGSVFLKNIHIKVNYLCYLHICLIYMGIQRQKICDVGSSVFQHGSKSR